MKNEEAGKREREIKRDKHAQRESLLLAWHASCVSCTGISSSTSGPRLNILKSGRWVQAGAGPGWGDCNQRQTSMGCIVSSEEDKPQAQPATLAEREAEARVKRKEAPNLVHNLVREKFGR